VLVHNDEEALKKRGVHQMGVLADASDGAEQDSDLGMHEVQGSERAQGVRLAQGAS
jgi:hypothetical protein